MHQVLVGESLLAFLLATLIFYFCHGFFSSVFFNTTYQAENFLPLHSVNPLFVFLLGRMKNYFYFEKISVSGMNTVNFYYVEAKVT